MMNQTNDFDYAQDDLRRAGESNHSKEDQMNLPSQDRGRSQGEAESGSELPGELPGKKEQPVTKSDVPPRGDRPSSKKVTL
jgi:hypothetical protein